MRGWTLAAAVVSVSVVASTAEAAILFDLLPVDNSAVLTGYVTYDLQVTTDTDWTAAAGLLELSEGSIYQHSLGLVSGPPNPDLIQFFPLIEFDTYVAGTAIGGAGDIGGTGYAFDNNRLDVSWYNMTDTDIGTTTIGRVTLTDDAVATLSIMLTTRNKEEAVFTIALGSGTAQAAAPSGGGLVTELTTTTASGVDLLYEDPRARILLPGTVDTRVRTSFNRWRTPFVPTAVDTLADSGLPEPASLAIATTCLGAVLLRRRGAQR